MFEILIVHAIHTKMTCHKNCTGSMMYVLLVKINDSVAATVIQSRQGISSETLISKHDQVSINI